MATVQSKAVEPVEAEAAAPPLASVAAPEDVAQEKKVDPHPQPPESKALVPADDQVKKAPAPAPGGSIDRDMALAQVEKDRRTSFIKAWEESEKSKVENKAQKKLSTVSSWENSKKADLEAKLRKLEEQLERQKAKYAEEMKNKIALIHKEAEERRAMIEAKRGEELLKAEEMAAKHRATGSVPKKILGCLG